MRIHILILLFGLSFFSAPTKACICIDDSLDWSIEKVYENIKSKDLIFIGELIEHDDYTYKFKALKFYKGTWYSNIIMGKKFDCSALPCTKGLWLVYANKIDDFIDISLCDKLTRNISTITIARVPLDLVSRDSIRLSRNDIYEIAQNEYIKHFNNFTQEIVILDSIKPVNNNKSLYFLIGISLIFNFIILGILLTQLKRKK